MRKNFLNILKLHRQIAIIICSAWLLCSLAEVSAASGKKVTGVQIKQGDYTEHTISVTVGKKTSTQKFVCYKKKAGKVSVSKKKYYFTNFDTLLKNAKTTLRYARKATEKKKATNALNIIKILRRDGAALCDESPPPATEDYLSMLPYDGEFGLKQASRLVEVFALGGRIGLADSYVAMGLENAVNDLTTWKSDVTEEAFLRELTCDTNPRDTTRDCFENNNINDFYLDGFLSGLNHRMIYSNNPAFMTLFQFAMDERAPGNPRVLDSESQWMFPQYVAMVDRFMINGDYKNYMQEWVKNGFIHGQWLSGKANHSGILKTGNEDFFREFNELATTGLYQPNGSPVYNDFDVYNGSLVCSGLAESRVQDANGNRIKVIGFFTDLHAPGTKTLYAGTPYQIQVDTMEDLARETFIKLKDQVAYELARRMWNRYINPYGNPQAYQRLAQIILENDFKLWPVYRAMMKSKAFYASRSYKSILKNPNELYVSFVRMSGMPIDNYRTMSEIFSDIGMHLGQPPTVFGFSYRNRELAGDIYQLERFNGFVTHMLYQNLADIKKNYGWTPYTGLAQGFPLTGDPARDMVTEYLKRLNLTDSVNDSQKDKMVEFLNYYLGDCGNQNDPLCFTYDGRRKKLYRDAPDLGDPDDDQYRARMLHVMLAGLPAFGAK